MKEDTESLSAVSSRTDHSSLTPRRKGDPAYPAAVLICSYLQGLAVRSALHEAVHRNPHRALLGRRLVQAHTGLPDMVLHNRHRDHLVAVLLQRMELRDVAHRDDDLPQIQHLGVAVSHLDSPTGMDTLFNITVVIYTVISYGLYCILPLLAQNRQSQLCITFAANKVQTFGYMTCKSIKLQ